MQRRIESRMIKAGSTDQPAAGPGGPRHRPERRRRAAPPSPSSVVRPPRRGPRPRFRPRAVSGAGALSAWAERQAHSGGSPLLDAALPEFERVLIRTALKRTQGHRQEAAKLIGWGRNTLTRKLKELGMNGEDADA